MDSLLHDVDHGALGVSVGRVHTIEFQKRGLPHMHLIVFLQRNSKLRSPEAIDSLISAEIPEDDHQLRPMVLKFMIHGPCGIFNTAAPCMEEGNCIRHFPKPFRPQSTLSED